LGNDSALAVSTTAVGIGTSSPAGKLHISGDGAAANLIRLQNTGAGTNGFFDISVTSTEAQVIANYSTTAIPMLFLTGAAERLRITSTGNVGIGTSTPAAKLDVNQTNQSGDNDFIRLTTDATSGSLSLGIYPSSNNSLSFIGSNALFSSGGVTRLNAAAGGSLLSMNTDSIVVYVSSGAANPVERMRIDSSGNVGIGTTAPSNFEGVTFGDSILDVNGVIQVRGDATNGNALVQFGGSTYRKALMFSSVGTDVGYLGVAIAANGTDSSSTEVARFTPNGLTFNGDTAAANALDDYEEGTWTMGVSFGGASVGVTYGVQGGTYTKIGRQVTVNGFIILSSKGSSAGAAAITGLPFTSGNNSGNNSSASLWLFNVSFANQFQGIGDQNATTITLYETTEAGTVTTLEDTNFANDSRISVGLTYFV
jgi:hypothetical protein